MTFDFDGSAARTMHASGVRPNPIVDVFVIHDALPFGLSPCTQLRTGLSKPFNKLRANGCGVFVVSYENLDNWTMEQNAH